MFVHYLAGLQNDAASVHSLGRETSWDACVHEFDTERFAENMREAGAGYVFFTMMQRSRFLIAPNATFDRLTGYKPGEACSTRDLVGDLSASLSKRGIPLLLYWTGDGPLDDPKAGPALGWSPPNVTLRYVENWSAVAREYSERYGSKVAGWWVDGSYRFIGYDQAKLEVILRALKAGNPNAIVAFNPGVEDHVRPYTPLEDFTAGEQNQFFDRPVKRWIEGEQWHILSFLGAGAQGWGQPGSKYTKAELVDYVHDVNQAGGVVSIDALLFRDGSLDRSQLEILKALRPGLKIATSQTPIPPGNRAFKKPSKLLSVDGSHELEINGGKQFPRFGVDGNPSTVALAGGEWPWAYEVDLLEPIVLRRWKIRFGHGYATHFRLELSGDRKTWHMVADVDHHDGKPFESVFPATTARYARVVALKPDGENQPGTQMSVAELELYETEHP